MEQQGILMSTDFAVKQCKAHTPNDKNIHGVLTVKETSIATLPKSTALLDIFFSSNDHESQFYSFVSTFFYPFLRNKTEVNTSSSTG